MVILFEDIDNSFNFLVFQHSLVGFFFFLVFGCMTDKRRVIFGEKQIFDFLNIFGENMIANIGN